MQSAADLSSSRALVEARYPAATPELRPALDLFLHRYVAWCLKTSVANRDLPTLRALRPLYRTRPSLQHRMLLALANLPAPLARAAYGAGSGAKALARRFAAAKWKARSTGKG